MVATGGKKGKNSWISFVMKIKKEENLPSLKAAMQAASKRKSEWKRGGGDSDLSDVVTETEVVEESESPVEVMEEDEYVGGRKRARTARRGRSARRGRARTARRGRTARRSRGRSQKRA